MDSVLDMLILKELDVSIQLYMIILVFFAYRELLVIYHQLSTKLIKRLKISIKNNSFRDLFGLQINCL